MLAAACVSVASTPARAQVVRPIPAAVFDIRGFYSGLGQDPITAKALGIEATTMPKRGLGGVAALHFYPVRGKKISLGLGGEGILARGHAQQKDPDTKLPTAAAVNQRLLGLAGMISLNFGHRNGWSYLTAGMGPLSFVTYTGDTKPTDPAPRKRTLNMGGGARWFSNAHVAFTFDVRYYLTRPEDPIAGYPGRQRVKLTVLSAGISFK